MKSVAFKRSLFICIGLLISQGAFAQTLQGALIQTLETNPNILITEKDRCAVAQDLREAKSGYLPTLDANAGYGREHSDNPFTNTQFDNDATLNRREAGLNANQMLFDGFATSSEVNRNSARLTSADYKIIGTAQDTALKGAETYLEVLKEQKLVSIAKNNLSVHQKLYDNIQKRSESGIDQSADLTQASGRLSLARSNLTAEQSNLTDAQSNYLQVVGDAPQNLMMPSLAPSSFMPKSKTQAVQIATNDHPILKSAKADMAAAYAQYEAAKSKNYPRFDLQLAANRNKNIDGIEGENNDESAMVRMNYNLYRGGGDNAHQNSTAYLYQESAEVMHKTYRQVINNAELSWNTWEAAQKQLPLLKAHQDASAKTFSAYEQQFQLGKRTLLDLLDAQNEYYQASQEYTDGQFNALDAQYRVLNSVGNFIQAQRIHFPVPVHNT